MQYIQVLKSIQTVGDDVKVMSKADYDKAQITYKKKVLVPVTETTEGKLVDIDADGNEIFLGTQLVTKDVTEMVDGEEVAKTFEEIQTVTYDPYKGQSILAIEGDFKILSDEEVEKIRKENQKPQVDEAKLAQQYAYIVNITTEKKKKVATIVKPDGVVQLDRDRGDEGFNNFEEAQKYAESFNSK